MEWLVCNSSTLPSHSDNVEPDRHPCIISSSKLFAWSSFIGPLWIGKPLTITLESNGFGSISGKTTRNRISLYTRKLNHWHEEVNGKNEKRAFKHIRFLWYWKTLSLWPCSFLSHECTYRPYTYSSAPNDVILSHHFALFRCSTSHYGWPFTSWLDVYMWILASTLLGEHSAMAVVRSSNARLRVEGCTISVLP